MQGNFNSLLYFTKHHISRKDRLHPMANHCKEWLYQLIRSKKFAEASSYIQAHIQEHQTEEYFVLFFILFRIRKEELQANAPDFFSSPLGCEPDTLLGHYTQIKLYLRRFEYQMPEEYLQEAIDYFITYQVSAQALYRIAQFACIDAHAAFHELSKMYGMNHCSEYETIFKQALDEENN